MSVSEVMIKKWGEPSAEWEKVGTIILLSKVKVKQDKEPGLWK